MGMCERREIRTEQNGAEKKLKYSPPIVATLLLSIVVALVERMVVVIAM